MQKDFGPAIHPGEPGNMIYRRMHLTKQLIGNVFCMIIPTGLSMLKDFLGGDVIVIMVPVSQEICLCICFQAFISLQIQSALKKLWLWAVCDIGKMAARYRIF